jgi:raffinose/stachyose/melibiose transport system permease protein
MARGKSWRSRASSASVCYALLVPTYVLLIVFTFIPVAWAFSTSLYRYEIGAESEFIGLANYYEYFGDPTFVASFATMLFLTGFALVARLTMPLFVAKLIISLPTERGRHFYRILFLVPIVVPLVAMQLIWRGMIYGEFGFVNQFLGAIGCGQWARGWLTDPSTALWAVAFIGFPFVGGFEVLIYYAGLASIPESVNDSARIDGATGLRKFFVIDVPMIMNQIRLIVALTIIAGVQAFEHIYVITEGGPGFKTLVPGLWMYYNAFSFQRMGYACAIGVVLFFVIAVLTLLNLKYLRSTEELQAR